MGRRPDARAARAGSAPRAHQTGAHALAATIGNRALTTVLQRGRGDKPVAINSASQHDTQDFNALPPAAKDAIRAILVDREDPRYYRERHTTDPETGSPKQGGVGVREYHVTPNAAARIVLRTQGQDVRVYWDPNHHQNSYIYHRVTNLPPLPPVQPVRARACACAGGDGAGTCGPPQPARQRRARQLGRMTL